MNWSFFDWQLDRALARWAVALNDPDLAAAYVTLIKDFLQSDAASELRWLAADSRDFVTQCAHCGGLIEMKREVVLAAFAGQQDVPPPPWPFPKSPPDGAMS